MTPPIPPGERLSEAEREALERVERLAEPGSPALSVCATVRRLLATPSDSGGEGLADYAGALLNNPHTGAPRDYRDVESDPTGILIHKEGEPLPTAATPTKPPSEHHPDCLRFTLEDCTCPAVAATPKTDDEMADEVLRRLRPMMEEHTKDWPATPTGPLSSRLRPNVECAPWVIAEVQKLEAVAAPSLSMLPTYDADDRFAGWKYVAATPSAGDAGYLCSRHRWDARALSCSTSNGPCRPARPQGAATLAVDEPTALGLVVGPFMYHHKMDEQAMRVAESFDRCRDLTIQNIRTHFAMLRAAALNPSQAGGGA